MPGKQSILILGAGIAGISCAYYLSKSDLFEEIIVIDKLPPLSFTTACSGENFREYWPQPMMNQFVSRSIKLMQGLSQDCENCFAMKYSGYDFVTHQQNHTIFPVNLDDMHSPETLVRVADTKTIQTQKPYLDQSIQAVEHINNAGSIDVYALGSRLLRLAKDNGVRFIQDEVIDIATDSTGYQLALISSGTINAQNLLLASGPFIAEHAKNLGFELPVYNFKQRKFVFRDSNKVIPRDMPFTIYADAQFLDWSTEEKLLIQDDQDFQWLLDEFPAGLHIKPEGQDQIKMGWAYNQQAEAPQWDVFSDDEFVSVVLKGGSRFIPGLAVYAEEIPTSIRHFAGYYTRTDDNLPLIGKLDQGLYTAGSLAGFGTMAACATGELITQIISREATSASLPEIAKYFSPLRFGNLELMQEILQYPSGQL